MKFSEPLIEGILLKRYKRFLADVQLPGEKKSILVHVPNSGSMIGCKEPGSPCLISDSKNPERKIRYTLEAVKSEGVWVGVNTSWPNKLMLELFNSKKPKAWTPFNHALLEYKISDHTRLDMIFRKFKTTPAAQMKRKDLDLLKSLQTRFVEIKNVSMAEPPTALFPDSVTERGLKHLVELEKLVKKGFEAEICFVVQRPDCKVFRPADQIDPAYAKKLREVSKKGVELSCHAFSVDNTGIHYSKTLKIDLSI